MDRETMIKLAREAGFELSSLGMTYTSGSLPELLERFAKLIAEHSASVEREACAKVCDDIDTEYEGEDVLATWCAAAIRVRGQ